MVEKCSELSNMCYYLLKREIAFFFSFKSCKYKSFKSEHQQQARLPVLT